MKRRNTKDVLDLKVSVLQFPWIYKREDVMKRRNRVGNIQREPKDDARTDTFTSFFSSYRQDGRGSKSKPTMPCEIRSNLAVFQPVGGQVLEKALMHRPGSSQKPTETCILCSNVYLCVKVIPRNMPILPPHGD
ncbi:hypothetical protein RRG08_066530 [Elysia crispata]|nr:hypothetical protein RRG08_066530 [Elysia crispata]